MSAGQPPLHATACAVIVHYGDPALTIAAVARLDSINRLDALIVVANDQLPEPASLAATRVRWLIPTSNLGFAGACAWAAERIPADAYIFLNADVDLDRHAVELCLDTLNIESVGVVGPVLYTPDGALNSACGGSSRFLHIPRQRPPKTTIADCEWVTGAAIFATSDAIRMAGFDASYFLGYEDADFCARVRRAGLRVVVHGGAVGTHISGSTGSPALISYYFQRNLIWFLQRQGHPTTAALVTLLRALALPRSLLGDILLNRQRCTLSRAFALLHGWTMRRTVGVPSPMEPIPIRWLPAESRPQPMASLVFDDRNG